MRKFIWFFEFILIVITVFLNCCEKEEEDIQPPVCNIITLADSSEFQIGDSIIINVEASDPDGLIKAVLFYIDDLGKYSVSSPPYQFRWATSNETVGFHIIKATAIDRGNNSSSDECIISLVIRPPVVITAEVSSITNNSATCGGNVVNDGGDTVTAKGVCWSTLPDPTLDDAKEYTTDSVGTGSYISYLTGLSRATTYYVRAYATNSEGTSYGEEVIFVTKPTSIAVTTSKVTNVTSASAVCGGEVTDDGGLSVIARGVCWNTTGEPTLLNNYTNDGAGTGRFTSSITGLFPNTKYYVRAFATNSKSTTYGNTVSFTTNPVLPVVITAEASLITCNSAQTGANIIDDGGMPVTQRGVCWSIYPAPTIKDSKTTNGSGTGSFTTNISGLIHTTTYFVRAYATNSVGTAYGNKVKFTTSPADLPRVETKPINNITTTTASGGGEITNDGCTPISTHGICWSTSSNPTISDHKTKDGFGTGSFISSITGLEKGTTYYVRAYATHESGYTYGNQVSFTTNADLPFVITKNVSSITASSAQSGGNITDDGGAPVTIKGVCWSTYSNPTISDNITNDGYGIGLFISTIAGLESGTTYYIRAYATNSEGTSYGDQVSFTTNVELPSVSTTIISYITLNSAQSGGNVTDDGGAPVTAKGICWSTSTNPTIYDYITNNGSGVGSFISSITGLENGTTYYVRAYATNNIGTAYGKEIGFITYSEEEIVIDYDGNMYLTVEIGNQIWMAENLKTTHYADGIPLIDGTGAGDISGDDSTKYWFFMGNNPSNKEKYGLLYTWAAIIDDASGRDTNPSGIQGICPTGWHVPSVSEWQVLVNYLGGNQIAGGKLKEAGTEYWRQPNTGATNESGFTALPGGIRDSDGGFRYAGTFGNFWTATEYYNNEVGVYGTYYEDSRVRFWKNSTKDFGHSIRCVRD